ncbi:hypothetical protein D3C73_1226210 [compost metagenome]
MGAVVRLVERRPVRTGTGAQPALAGKPTGNIEAVARATKPVRRGLRPGTGATDPVVQPAAAAGKNGADGLQLPV